MIAHMPFICELYILIEHRNLWADELTTYNNNKYMILGLSHRPNSTVSTFHALFFQKLIQTKI